MQKNEIHEKHYLYMQFYYKCEYAKRYLRHDILMWIHTKYYLRYYNCNMNACKILPETLYANLNTCERYCINERLLSTDENAYKRYYLIVRSTSQNGRGIT